MCHICLLFICFICLLLCLFCFIRLDSRRERCLLFSRNTRGLTFLVFSSYLIQEALKLRRFNVHTGWISKYLLQSALQPGRNTKATDFLRDSNWSSSENLKTTSLTFLLVSIRGCCSPAGKRRESGSSPSEKNLWQETEDQEICTTNRWRKRLILFPLFCSHWMFWSSQLVLVLMVILAGIPGPSSVRALKEQKYSWFCCRPAMVTDFCWGSATDTLTRSGYEQGCKRVTYYSNDQTSLTMIALQNLKLLTYFSSSHRVWIYSVLKLSHPAGPGRTWAAPSFTVTR